MHMPRTDAPAMERASPVCYAADFERDRTDAIVARLDELLEAERAGARVTRETAPHVQDAAIRDVVEAIHRDEVKWCVMLTRAIRNLERMPGTRTGSFYEKAMAIEDLGARLAFLNRGQGWVVKKVRELLPLVDDAAIRQGLTDMLAAHEANLDKVNALTGDPR